MNLEQKGGILFAIDALTRTLAFEADEGNVRLVQTMLAALFPRTPAPDTDAVTFVVRYTPDVDGVDDVAVARELWRDAMTREADELADRHGCEVEVHYEDMLERGAS